MYVIAVNFTIEPEHVEAFRAAVLAQAHNSLEHEPDCHVFDVCFDPAEPRRVFLYEVYTDEAAFKVHLATPHFIDFDATVRDWLEAKAVSAWLRQEPGAGA